MERRACSTRYKNINLEKKKNCNKWFPLCGLLNYFGKQNFRTGFSRTSKVLEFLC